MPRFFAGVAACFLLLTGAFLFWQGRAQPIPLPSAPPPRMANGLSPIPAAPSADPKSKEQKRFARSDKDENGQVTLAEMVEPRRKAYARLDLDQDGKLSFEEWSARTIDKFRDADRDKSQWLSAAEFATTAPKRKPKPACACG